MGQFLTRFTKNPAHPSWTRGGLCNVGLIF